MNYKIKYKKMFVLGFLLIFIILFKQNVIANDEYFNIVKDFQVKIDLIDINGTAIDNNNLVYNGQRVFIKIDWRALEDIKESINIKIGLPVNTDISSASFSSPLLGNVEILSKDKNNLTSLKIKGDLITSIFDANETTPILKDSSGTILVPTNIVVAPNSNDFNSSIIEMSVEGNNSAESTKNLISKNIPSILNGLKIEDLKLVDKLGKSEITGFEELYNNVSLLRLHYISGDKGIQDGDNLIINFNDVNQDLLGKILPYGKSNLDINDNNGNVIGKISFSENKTGNNTYAIISFNKNLMGYKNVKGYIDIVSEVNFTNTSSNETSLFLKINNKPYNILVYPPSPNEKENITRTENILEKDNTVRKYIIINEEDLILQNKNKNKNNEFEVVPNIIINEILEDEKSFIDKDSIRIARTINVKNNEKNSISDFVIDYDFLKKGKKLDYLGNIKEMWNGRTGLTIEEFEKFLGLGKIIEYKEDSNKNIIGFDLGLGALNISKGINGEFTGVESNNSLNKISKDNKTTGYIVYYNLININEEKTNIFNNSNNNSELGIFKILLQDGNTNEGIEGSKFEVYSHENKLVDTLTTDINGEAETIYLPFGDYNIIQIKAQTGYGLLEEKVSTIVYSNIGARQYNLKNYGKGKLRLVGKTDTGNINLQGISLNLVNILDENKIIEEINLNSIGEGFSSELPFGVYYLIENTNTSNFLLEEEKIQISLSHKNLDDKNTKNIILEYLEDLHEIEEEKSPLGNVNTSVENKNPVKINEENSPALTVRIEAKKSPSSIDELDKNNPRTSDNEIFNRIIIFIIMLIIFVLLATKYLIKIRGEKLFINKK